MKIFVIDNGSQWTHRIWRTLRDLDVETQIIANSTPLEKLKDVDGLVLSGGSMRVGKGESDACEVGGNNIVYAKEFGKPVLGICAGFQIIAQAYGGTVKPAKTPEFGAVELEIDFADDLFASLSKRFTVWASHNDEVASAPHFITLAHSKDCAIHAFKHNSLPIYGTLFHPEVQHTQNGEAILENFVRVCKR